MSIDPEVRAARMKYIRAQMAKTGLSGRPSRYVVLQQWNRVVDVDRDFELDVPPLPLVPSPEQPLWAVVGDNALVEVRVVEPRPDGLWVRQVKHPAQFLAPVDTLRALPVPFHPVAVPRHRLHRYIGHSAQAAIYRTRRRLA